MIVTIACSTGERYLSTPLAAEAKAEVGGEPAPAPVWFRPLPVSFR